MTYNHMDSSGSSSLHLTPPVSRVAPFIPHLSVVCGPVVRCPVIRGRKPAFRNQH